jgi:hypothetical protein
MKLLMRIAALAALSICASAATRITITLRLNDGTTAASGYVYVVGPKGSGAYVSTSRKITLASGVFDTSLQGCPACSYDITYHFTDANGRAVVSPPSERWSVPDVASTITSRDVLLGGPAAYNLINANDINPAGLLPGQLRLWSGTAWEAAYPADAASVPWGSITGDITAQSDLIAAFALKMAAVAGSGALRIQAGVPSLVTGNAADCVKVDGSSGPCGTGEGGAVDSVFGRIGAVTAQAGDYTTSQITESGNLYFTGSRVLSTMSGLYEVPLTFSAPLQRSGNTISCPTCSSGGGTWGSITGTLSNQTDLSNALNGKAASVHGHGIADITALQAALDAKAATSHAHGIADTTGLQTALDAKIPSAEKGANNGVATLDSAGKIPAVQLPASSGMTAVVQDTAPQLGGNLDMNGFNVGGISATLLGYLTGLTGAIQGQIDGKSGTGHNHDATYTPLSLLTTLGDLPYKGAGGGWSRLPGNTLAAKRLLCQTGTGSVSAAPTWCALVAGDIPDIAQSQVTGLVAALAAKAASNASTTINSVPCALGSTCTVPTGIVSQTTGLASALPATCTAASAAALQVYYATDTTDWYMCGATNTWLRLLSTLPGAAFSMSGTEQSALATPAAGAGACWFDSTEHNLNCKLNGSATILRMISLSTTVLGYLSTVSSNVQTQLDGKAATNANTTGTAGGLSGTALGGDVTNSGNTVTLAAKHKTRSFGFILGADDGSALVDTNDQADIWANNLGFGVHITSITCYTDAGTSTINLARNDGSAANILASSLTCSTSGATSTTFTSGEDAISDGHRIDLAVVAAAASGTPKRITVMVRYTVD